MSIETMTKLATYTVSASGGDTSVTFSNIPQTYTDLVVKMSTRSDRASSNTDWVYVSFNGSTVNFSAKSVGGDGSGLSNYSAFPRIFGISTASSATASTFGNSEIYIPNYTSANFKSWSSDQVTENNATYAEAQLVAGLWSDTSAITSITLTQRVGTNFTQYSSFTLYGIRNARRTTGNSIKATGGNISFDGTYVVHTFTSSGTFTPTVAIPRADYLVVAGGGGGGGGSSGGDGEGGGGGAGGLRSTVTATGGGGSLESALSLAANTNYTVTVGAGGSGAANHTVNGTNGSNSAFHTITSTGGGYGGSRDNSVRFGNAGGSGGGGGQRDDSTANYGAGTANQGYNGGNGWNAGEPSGAGGGGGAGGAGQAAVSKDVGGAGGASLSVSISGTSTAYAGGGGGAGYVTGGASGGAGAGQGSSFTTTNTKNATANTGSGGGGQTASGGTGGSGIVIIRYKA